MKYISYPENFDISYPLSKIIMYQKLDEYINDHKNKLNSCLKLIQYKPKLKLKRKDPEKFVLCNNYIENPRKRDIIIEELLEEIFPNYDRKDKNYENIKMTNNVID